ncbi:MAG TPA: hypothetical protein VGU26_08255, partial [Gaiellaceae bacterium]|nr:hypothetical protein [Gaiellaceae bacterium]
APHLAIQPVAAGGSTGGGRERLHQLPLAVLSALILVAFAGSTAGAQSEARATLIVKNSRHGRVLFDGRGFALYASGCEASVNSRNSPVTR